MWQWCRYCFAWHLCTAQLSASNVSYFYWYGFNFGKGFRVKFLLLFFSDLLNCNHVVSLMRQSSPTCVRWQVSNEPVHFQRKKAPNKLQREQWSMCFRSSNRTRKKCKLLPLMRTKMEEKTKWKMMMMTHCQHITNWKNYKQNCGHRDYVIDTISFYSCPKSIALKPEKS